jgi:iron complex outermembrane recepter protein
MRYLTRSEIHRRYLPMIRAAVRLALSSSLVLCLGVAGATAAEPDSLDEVTITGAKLRALDDKAVTASRSDLTARETPATLDAIDADQMLGRGYSTFEQAAMTK